MNKEAFKKSLQEGAVPEGLSELQAGLWHAANDNWQAAHEVAQAHEGERDFDHLHAYLHRAEGDEWNANYWYRRAGVKMPDQSLPDELDNLINLWLV
ncbi:hypothetical protein ABDK00_002320 [Niabella insulamsoli]|uniref:hypothetical protein n=1 Tax=Niabella insulamsoli TaxID=3144874 RepID=UPI0031FE3AC5